MSSSDSSDDENLQNIREAADNQFINDSMFKGTPKTGIYLAHRRIKSTST